MTTWFDYLKAGLTRHLPKDQLSGQEKPAKPYSQLAILRPFLGRHWRKGILGVVIILCASLLSFPMPLINRFLVDDVILARRLDLLWLAVSLMVGAKVFSMAAGALERFYFTRFEQNVMLDLQNHLLKHALKLPKAFFDGKEVGYLISRLSSDVQGLRWFFSSSVVYIATSIIRFCGGIAFLFYLEWRLGIVTLVVLPLLVISARYFSLRMRVLSHYGMEQHANILQRFEEILAAIPLVKAFTAEKREEKRVMEELKKNNQIEMEQSTVGTLANLIMNVVPDIARAVVLVAGVYWVIKGQWTLGSLLAFQSYLGYVYGPALYLASANLQLQNALAALERVSVIFNIAPEDNLAGGQKVEHLKGDIRFENVSFSYDGRDVVLEDISFHIRAGEHVTIVGPSGVGKTTLVSLLLQFYRPSSGKIYLDGALTEEYELYSLRQRIGYVSQSTLLMAGSLRENLCYGNPDATQAEMERAVEIAGIREFVLSQSEGYNTIIGERGINLSEGQKQRLSIARALLKNPDILLLDEPTSAVDHVAEHSIFNALPQITHDKTMIIITHRLPALTTAEHLLVLNEGRLEAVGTHDQLIKASPYYRSLFEEEKT
jgi:ABC-type bacteriocin/lantibiotic exporter with double-glycine peptidase domain